MRFVEGVCVLVAIGLPSLAWVCEGEEEENSYSCDIFSPTNFNISIGKHVNICDTVLKMHRYNTTCALNLET